MWAIFFTLNCLSKHFHSHTSLILFISRNLPCYLTFCFLFIWLIQLNTSFLHLTIRTVFRGVILRDWKGGPYNPELLRDRNWRRYLIWKGKPQTPLHTATVIMKCALRFHNLFEIFSWTAKLLLFVRSYKKGDFLDIIKKIWEFVNGNDE